MSVNEQDLELLETFLDGELSPGEADLLQTRLASEVELASALRELRQQRELRAQLWQAIEPGEASVAALTARVSHDVGRDQAWSQRLGALRYVSGIAASIVVGLVVGWYARGPVGAPGTAAPPQAPPPAVASNTPANHAGTRANPAGPVDNSGNIRFVNNAVGGHGPYQVFITDRTGRVLTEPQRFDRLEDAAQYTKDLSRWQPGHRTPSGTRLINDER